jgi:ectoine hydroxylase-related dioxygenase (phytanoyl-CoA dioxygenase family)
MSVTDEHWEHWRENGYVVVEHFLTSGEVLNAQRDLRARFPSELHYRTAPGLFRDASGVVSREPPFLGETLNFVSVHPDIIAFAKLVLGTERIVPTYALVWAKYGNIDCWDQPLHVDDMYQSPLNPEDHDRCEEVSFIIYLVDMTEYNGPTYIVSKKHTRDLPLIPYLRPRNAFPELYRHERPVLGSAGLMLIYDARTTFHRGSLFVRPRGVRFSLHLSYQRADGSSTGYGAWGGWGRVL